MNGIQSLMQGYNLGGAVGEQARQAPAMPQGMPQPAMPNDPRMGAAMGLVDDSVEKFNLDPQTEALMLKNQALDLLKAADNVGKMNAPQQDTNIQEQTEQGIAGMLQRLSPGMQQRGQQMQRSQARQMLGGGAPARPPMGGMPTMGAPNMARMANGGIVGYAGPDGSQVGMKPTLGAVPPSAVGDEAIKQFAAQYTDLQAGLAAATNPEDKAQSQQLIQDLVRDMGNAHATVMQYLDSTKGFVAPRTSGMARGGIIGYNTGGRAEQQRQAGAAYAARQAEARENQSIVTAKNNRYVALLSEGVPAEEARAIVEAEALAASGERIPFEMRPNSARDVGNVANIGGITGLLAKAGQKEPPFRMQGVEETTPTVGTQYDPTGTKSAGLPSGTAQDNFVPAVGALATAPPALQEFTPDALDLLTQGKLTDALNADPNTAATTRGDRLRELTGLDDLMARRIESERAVRAQKESRLSPEQTRKRRLQAGLARLAEQGLGGFGAGRTSEMDKIAAERLGIEETSLADLNSLIAEKRAMGMTQFEAENSARAETQNSQDNAATAAGRRTDARLAAFTTSRENVLNRAATAEESRLNRLNQKAIAEIQTSGSQFGRSLGIRIEALRAQAGPGASQIEIENQALQSLVDDNLRSALGRLGIQEDDQNRKIINDSIDAATKIFQNNVTNMSKDPAVLQQEILNLAEKIRQDLYGSTVSSGGTYPPMPTERSQLVQGTIYSTSQGNARWNGTNFIPVN